MTKHCEVCANFRSENEGNDGRRFVEVDFGTRRVLLCTGHARIAENSGVKTFEELREFYGSGRRSHLPRRRPGPLQPDGKPRGKGRRATDLAV